MHGLPVPPAPLVGRVREVAAVGRLLRAGGHRLVTLHGAPGAGKTRLALEVAHQLRVAFRHGAVFVDLAPLGDPSLVASAIAHALALGEPGGEVPERVVREYVRQKQLLLVLDNFEHVLGAAPLVGDLLATCPGLKVLATSRERLRLAAERRFPVPPLRTPPLADATHLGEAALERLAENEAVALFVERARAADPDFVLSPANARQVAEICVRLDGLPLAIELAASTLLPTESLLARLDDRLRLLTRGVRDGPPRHRTLRTTIAWSYDLLGGAEQALFRRLAVFAGGCTPQGAEAVADGTGDSAASTDGGAEADVLHVLASLLDKGLLERETPSRVDRALWTGGASPRYRMLETIREFAHDRLVAAGEAGEASERHARHFLAEAEHAECELSGAEQVGWLDRLEREHDNLRAALRWAGRTGRRELGQRLAGALCAFWFVRGHVDEGRAWLESFLELGGSGDGKAGAGDAGTAVATAVRAKARFSAGFLAAFQDARGATLHFEQGLRLARQGDERSVEGWCLLGLGRIALVRRDLDGARAHYEDALGIFRSLDERPGIGWASIGLGRIAHLQARPEEAKDYHEAALGVWRNVGDCWGLGTALRSVANEAYILGDYARAASLYAENLTLFRRLGFRAATAWSLNACGDVERCRDDLPRAAALYEEALDLFRDVGIADGEAWSLHNLAWIDLRRDEPSVARPLLLESLSRFEVLADRIGTAACLQGLGAVALLEGDPHRGAYLLGAADVVAAGSVLEPADRAERERVEGAIRAALGEGPFAEALAAGRCLSPEHAVAEGRTPPTRHPAPEGGAGGHTRSARTEPASRAKLTGRELEVLRLVAEGRSNGEIGDALGIESRTVEAHLTHIGRKLRLTRRAVVAGARDLLRPVPGAHPQADTHRQAGAHSTADAHS